MQKLENDALTIMISETGAEMHTIIGKNGVDYLLHEDTYWDEHAPITFPIFGKLVDDSYHYDGKTYKMGNHGFARFLDFKLLSATDTEATYQLQSNEETLKQYPFHFLLLTHYKIEGSTLTVSYTVMNDDDKDMPFSIGHHPAYNIPLTPDTEFSDYKIVFDSVEGMQHLLTGDPSMRTGEAEPFDLLEGNTFSLDYDKFTDEGSIFLTLPNTNTISVVSDKNDHGLTIHVEEFGYTTLWTKKGSSFLAIEALNGLSDKFGEVGNIEDKEGIMILKPGEKKDFTYTVDFH